MKIIADLHTHTNVSQHAYSTLDEIARAAKAAGFLAFGITNHGPEMADGALAHHFLCMKGLPKEIMGMKFYAGAEVNIKSFDGRLDLPDQILDALDLIIASYHIEAIPPSTVQDHTNGWLHVIHNPFVDCLGHMGNPVYQCDLKTVVKECSIYHKLIEINANSFVVRPGSDKNCREIALLCMQYQVPVLISSDAHSCYSVGNHTFAIQMLESIDFPEELIVNSSYERLKKYLP